MVDKDELGLGVAEEDGDGAGVEAGVDVVKDGAGHRHGELELVHGGGVGCHYRNHFTSLDTEGGERRSELKAAAVGLRPCEGDGVVDDGRAVAVDGGGSLKKAKRSERR